MTREEILKMEAGPEMDRLVAEKVMRFVFEDLPLTDEDKPEPRTFWIGPPMPYSTNIKAAWMVVEKMHDSGWFFSITRYSNCTDPWNAEFGSVLPRVHAPTAPLAICRAALLAVLA